MLRRKLRCHGCGGTSQNERAGVARAWVCASCEAVNHVDERGNTTDPPADLTARIQPLRFTQRAPTSRSPTPDSIMSAPGGSPFCERCQRNAIIVNRTMAEYLPDEADPDYKRKEKMAAQYQAQLEERYPLVCEHCIERVQARIRQAGFLAKAEAMGRKLRQSRKYEDKQRTFRQLATLAIIFVWKWVYIASLVAAFTWHVFGSIADFPDGDQDFDLSQCLREAAFFRTVDKSCVVSSEARSWLFYALVGEFVTFAWNPKLEYMTTHANRHMSGVVKQWMIRLFMVALNVGTWKSFGEASVQENGVASSERVEFFRYTHMILLVTQVLVTYLSWTTVKIYYISTRELLRPLTANLPQAPVSRDTTPHASPQKLLPDQTSFDSMAASLGHSFPANPNSYDPPSPTLTATSTATTVEESNFTPWRRQSIAPVSYGDEMDWTPTKPRFNPNPPTLLQHRMPSMSPTKSSYTPCEPPTPTYTSSAFRAHADPNPFHRRVPAAPKAPAASMRDPWKRPAWQPDPLLREKNLFEEDKERNASLGAGLHGKGVPRTVEQEARLFEPPKLRYGAEAYGARRASTGLEQTFDDTFSNLFTK